jgi:hypothetical protein
LGIVVPPVGRQRKISMNEENKIGAVLDREGPSHGSRDCKGAVTPCH